MNALMAASRYCERTDAAFWSEPVNALTSLAFIVAAIMAARLTFAAREPWRADRVLLVLAILMTGFGSLLWHTLAAPWAQWADVIPIALFINLYLLAFLTRLARLRRPAVVVLFILFLLLNAGVFALFPVGFLNGSIYYVPTLATLLLMAVYCRFARLRQASTLVLMAAGFSVSLLLRSIDAGVCSAIPWGSHFAWHLLNAGIMYLAVRSLVD